LVGLAVPGYPGGPIQREEEAMSDQEPQVPDQVEGEPVVEVQEATDPLTPEEVREAQESDAGQA
jgi:hypothetical protein